MSLKILSYHIDFFPNNCGVVCDENEESFHQNISVLDRRHLGKFNAFMITDCCWNVTKDAPEPDYKQNDKIEKFKILA